MFCKICGKENSPSSLYCSNDGIKLEKKETDLRTEKTDQKYCNNCQNKVAEADLYCSNCGQSLYSVNRGKNKKIDFKAAGEKISFPQKRENKREKGQSTIGIEELIKYGLGISFLALIASILMAVFINMGLSNALSSELGIDLDLKLVKLLDPLSIINAGSMQARARSFTGDMISISTSGIFFIFLMDSLLVFTFIGGYISKKTGEKELLKEFGIVALVYGVFIALMSLFARGQIEFNLPYGIGYEIANISRSYSMLSLVFRGFIHAFFAMNFGHGLMSFISNFKEKKPRPLEIVSLVIAVSLLFAFIASSFLIDGDIYYSPNNKFAEIASFIVKVQLALYSMISMNMGKIVMGVDGSNSVFSLLNNSEVLSDLGVGAGYLYLGLLITMVLFFLYGRNIKREGRGNEEIIYTAVLFALSISLIGYLGSIEIKIDQMEYLYYKSSYLMTFLGSFLISLSMSLSGYLLAGSREGGRRDV